MRAFEEMPSIDCGLNPTAVNDEKNETGKAGVLFLLVSLLFLILSWRKQTKES